MTFGSVGAYLGLRLAQESQICPYWFGLPGVISAWSGTCFGTWFRARSQPQRHLHLQEMLSARDAAMAAASCLSLSIGLSGSLHQKHIFSGCDSM